MASARLMLEWAILLALAIAAAAYLHASGAANRIDNQILDYGSSLTRPAVSEDIVLVTIDDASLKRIGAWPWSRATHAKLVENLDAAGAKAVVLDVLFLEPTDEEADGALADAMRASGNVLLPHTFGPRPMTEDGQDPVLPLPELQSAAAGLGHVALAPDGDGVLRRFDLAYDLDGQTYPHLTVTLMEALGRPVPADRIERDAIVPFQPRGDFVQESASNVIAGATPPAFLRDKIVLIGATAQGMGDRYSVASGAVGLMTGIETQANLTNALMNDALIEPVAQIWQNAAATIALLLLFLTFWYLSPRYVLVCAVGLIVVLLCACAVLLFAARLWFAPASVIAVIMLAYPLWSWRRLSHASRYLDREAMRLTGDGIAVKEKDGLDYVTRQIEQLRGIIKTVHSSLSFLRRVIEAAPDAIIVLGEDDTVEMLNAKAEQLFPYWDAQDKPSFGEFLLSSESRLERDRTELVTRDGRTFLIARALLAETQTQGEVGSIIALREVTELRRLDTERQQMLEFLSHDMRTPQVAIVGLTRSASEAGETTPDTVRRIRMQAERTLKLADDFVQLARLDSPNLQIEDCDIGALVEEACDRAFTQAESRQISLVQDVPEDPIFAPADASLIARMLDNLIGNAIKYSDELGHVSVSLKQGSGDSLRILVSDRGPGLSEARLAEPFARFGAHATHAGPSAGLGLALVKKVVDAHNGTIEVRSANGAGTTFAINLPMESL
ncbi:MAG: CHASE2 domain-containing protein [Pseudomonadota bacterium]